MRQKVQNKLRSRAGESLVETLISLLVSSAALLMLAGAITTASRLVTTSRDTLDEYYANNERLSTMDVSMDVSGSPPPSFVSGGGEITIDNDNDNVEITLGNGNDEVTFYINNVFSKTPVISYHYTPDAGGGGTS